VTTQSITDRIEMVAELSIIRAVSAIKEDADLLSDVLHNISYKDPAKAPYREAFLAVLKNIEALAKTTSDCFAALCINDQETI
jgi:hypothetical protein